MLKCIEDIGDFDVISRCGRWKQSSGWIMLYNILCKSIRLKIWNYCRWKETWMRRLPWLHQRPMGIANKAGIEWLHHFQNKWTDIQTFGIFKVLFFINIKSVKTPLSKHIRTRSTDVAKCDAFCTCENIHEDECGTCTTRGCEDENESRDWKGKVEIVVCARLVITLLVNWGKGWSFYKG